MLRAIVMEIRPESSSSSRRVGWGEHEFKVLPRVGDTISVNSHPVDREFDECHVYEVVRVEMPLGSQDCAADVFVVHRGTIFDGHEDERKIAGEKFVPYED